MNPAALALVVALQVPDAMAPRASGTLEGRPPASQTSPIQTLVDAAPDGATVTVDAGTYVGDLVLDRPVALVGRGRPVLVGSGTGSVVRVRASDVTIDGFDIDGRGGGDLANDPSGVHVAAARAVVRNCRIVNALFGIYLREAHDARVEDCTVRGIKEREPGEKGSGIHVWNTERFRLTGNTVTDARDGFYIQSSSNGVIARNMARDLRYGLHYMFSDDNVFEDNVFERGAAGAALMYSRRMTFRRNQFLDNRGFASVGLLLKTCDDVVAEDNLVANNARGIFIEGSYRNVFRRNVIAESDTALTIYDSSGNNRFEDNVFVANLSPLMLVGRRTDTVFAANYWSDNDEPDLDGDGITDRPYRLSSVFDHFRGNLTAADLFAQGFAASALSIAERTFPVLSPVQVVDERPRARPPVLPDVPNPRRGAPTVNRTGVATACIALAAGLAVLSLGRRPAAEAAS